MKHVVFVSITVAVLMVASSTLALQAELERYQQVIDVQKICNTGITPEIVQLYEVAVSAMNEAKDRAGRQPRQARSDSPIDAAQSSNVEQSEGPTNFWGPVAPEIALSNCLPGGGE